MYLICNLAVHFWYLPHSINWTWEFKTSSRSPQNYFDEPFNRYINFSKIFATSVKWISKHCKTSLLLIILMLERSLLTNTAFQNLNPILWNLCQPNSFIQIPSIIINAHNLNYHTSWIYNTLTTVSVSRTQAVPEAVSETSLSSSRLFWQHDCKFYG